MRSSFLGRGADSSGRRGEIVTKRPADNSMPTWQDLGFSESVLEKNLRALGKTRPDLAREIGAAGVHPGLTIARDESGQPRVFKRLRRTWLRIEETETEQSRPTTSFGKSSPIGPSILCGLGSGERAHRLAQATSADRPLYVWEPDPALIYLALARRDFSEFLERGAITILFGSDLESATATSGATLLRHPLMEPFVKDAVDNAIVPSRPGSTPTQSFEKKKRALVIEGELLESEIARALRTKGWDVWRLSIASLTRNQIEREICGWRPDLLIGINFDPAIAQLAGRWHLPYVAWEIDPAASSIPKLEAADPAASAAHIFTWKHGRVDVFRRAGYRHVEYLPLAADPESRAASGLDKDYADTLLFVGSCMQKNAQRLIDCFTRGVAQDPVRRASWSAFLHEVSAIESAVEKNPCMRGIESMLRELLDRRRLPHEITIDGAAADVIVLVGESVASGKRRALARVLAQDPSFKLFGEDDWKSVIPPKSYGGAAGYGATLSRLYASSAITVDMNRVYQSDIVTLRVFETVAAGGFILAEWSEDLSDVFEIGKEIAAYSSVGELLEMVRFFKAHPEVRADMKSAARDRLLRDHTVASRIDRMLERTFVSGQATIIVDRPRSFDPSIP